MDLLSAFLHIEIVHENPDMAAKFLQEVFGAEQVEEHLSNHVEAMLPGVRVLHMRMGNVIFQFVKPNEMLASWREQLESTGPGVHNISIQIDNLDGVEQAMVSRGAKIYSDFMFDFSAVAPNCPGPLRALNIDAREQSGLRFEMVPTEYGYQPPH